MLPQVEHLRAAADKAQQELDQAMAAVVAAEASHPLVTPTALKQAGVVVPRVLVRGAEGTMLTGEAGGGAAAGAAAGARAAGGATELVAVPAEKERAEMYNKDQAETGEECCLSLLEEEVIGCTCLGLATRLVMSRQSIHSSYTA